MTRTVDKLDPQHSAGARAKGLFVTATGTGCGKTFVTRALAAGLRGRGLRVPALKPIETGCAPDPLDALALARAAGAPELAYVPGFYRVAPALCPYAVTLEHGTPAPDLEVLCGAIEEHATRADFVLVEGAGGLLVPLDAQRTNAELAARLGYPLLVVAPDRLGTLSHVLTVLESAAMRALSVAAVILVRVERDPDSSAQSNARILAQRTTAPVLQLPYLEQADAEVDQARVDAALAQAAEQAGLLTLVAALAQR